MNAGLLFWPGAIVFLVTLVLFGAAIVRSPVLEDSIAQERVVVNKHARRDKVNIERETAFAKAYWARNPDVAQSSYCGEGGALGVFGAREHYDRMGRAEGRAWGQ